MKLLNPHLTAGEIAMTTNTMRAEELVVLQESIKEEHAVQSSFQESNWTTQAFGVVIGIVALLLLSRLSRWQSKRLQH